MALFAVTYVKQSSYEAVIEAEDEGKARELFVSGYDDTGDVELELIEAVMVRIDPLGVVGDAQDECADVQDDSDVSA